MSNPAPDLSAVIYTRVSQASQVEKYGLAAQEAACRAYCLGRGLTVLEVFSDKGISGTVQARPQIIALKEYLDKGTVRHVIFYEISRLARDLTVMGNILKEIQNVDEMLHCHFVSQNLDVVAGQSQLTLHIFGAIAEEERRTIIARTTGGRLQAMKEGKWVGGKLPDGYRVAYDDKQNAVITVVPERARVIKAIYDRYLLPDESYLSVARHMNTLGPQYAKPNGKEWSMTDIGSRLRNHSAYSGHFFQNKRVTSRKTGKLIPVSEMEWYPQSPVTRIIYSNIALKVKAKLASRTTVKGRRSQTTMLFAGFLYCAHCGSRLAIVKTGMTHVRRNEMTHTPPSYYRCTYSSTSPSVVRKRKCVGCERISTLQDDSIWNAVVSTVVIYSITYNVNTAIQQAKGNSKWVKFIDGQIKTDKQELDKLRMKQEEVLQLYLADEIDRELYVTANSGLVRQIADLQLHYSSLRQQRLEGVITKEELDRGRSTLKRDVDRLKNAVTIEDKRSAMQAIGIRIIVTAKNDYDVSLQSPIMGKKTMPGRFL